MKYMLTAAALFGLLAVVLGAFGEHALARQMTAHDYNTWEVGARYHFYHALAASLAGMLAAANPAARGWALRACMLFMLGILLFCGSLYLFAVTHIHILAFATPLGGLCFILGWLSLALAGWKSAPKT